MHGSSVIAQRRLDTDDDLEMSFSGILSCNLSVLGRNTWIIDSGTSDHMTCSPEKLINFKVADANLTITLPTGDVTKITHKDDMK